MNRFLLLCALAIVPAAAASNAGSEPVYQTADGNNVSIESLYFNSGTTLGGTGTFDFHLGTVLLPPVAALTLNGTAGLGFLDLPSQSSAPSYLAGNIRIYSDSSNKLAWIGGTGFVRSLDGAITANRSYTLPDVSGTLVTSGNLGSHGNLVYSSNVLDTAQGILATDSPTFAGLTLNGTVNGVTIPSASDTAALLGKAQTFSAVDTFSAGVLTNSLNVATGTALTIGGASIVTTLPGTTSASSSTAGAFIVGNGTSSTSVAIGGGKVNIGGTLIVGGHTTFEGVTSTGATGSGNLVYSAGPSFTGTLNAAAIVATGTVQIDGHIGIAASGPSSASDMIDNAVETNWSGTYIGSNMEPQGVQTSTSFSGVLAGIAASPIINASNTQNWTGFMDGVLAQPSVAVGATGTITQIRGLDGSVDVNATTGLTVIEAIGVLARNSFTAGATITDSIGVEVLQQTTGATSNIDFGILTSSIPTGNYALYVGDGYQSYLGTGNVTHGGTSTFTGNVSIGSTPQTNIGLFLAPSLSIANTEVAIAVSPSFSPQGNSFASEGIQVSPTLITGSNTGESIFGILVNTPVENLTGGGTITGGYQLAINAPSTHQAGAISVTSGAVQLGSGVVSGTGYLDFAGSQGSSATAGHGNMGGNSSYGAITIGNGSISDWTVQDNSGSLAIELTHGTLGVVFEGNIASTSTTTGTIVDNGGLGIAGAAFIGGAVNIASTLTVADATLHRTTTTLTNGAAAATATLTNAPTSGNPTKWAPVNDNGTTRYVPMW